MPVQPCSPATLSWTPLDVPAASHTLFPHGMFLHTELWVRVLLSTIVSSTLHTLEVYLLAHQCVFIAHYNLSALAVALGTPWPSRDKAKEGQSRVRGMGYSPGPGFPGYAGWSGKASPWQQSRDRAFQNQTPEAEACQNTTALLGRKKVVHGVYWVGDPSQEILGGLRTPVLRSFQRVLSRSNRR